MKSWKVLIIDGQGGGIGKQLTQIIKEAFPSLRIHAVGTNAVATQAMLKAGADDGSTGENAVIVGCRKADIIIGPLGIVIADSLMGEITPKMVIAIGQSNAVRILIPVNQCDNRIAGIDNYSLSFLMRSCIDQIRQIINNQD
ncbi:MAG: DUF3842 family protein [Flexilinea sp.]|nr:DUF3842 family protein [Flexilinea sp.]